MTAPGPVLSPIAGLFNGLVRHLNRRLRARIAELNALLDDAYNTHAALATAADFADSQAAGYVTPLEER